MPARSARFLTWPELDSVMYGYERRLQRAQQLPRLVAWETHNLRQSLLEKPEYSRSPQAYWPLHLLDDPQPEAPKAKPLTAEFLARMEKRLGRSFTFEPSEN